MNASDRVKSAGFWDTFQTWPVNEEWAQELYNFVICGFRPGSFHNACFANNLFRASIHSHVSNQWKQIVEMMKWINEFAPKGSWGSYENVNYWIGLTKEERDEILYDIGYILTDEEVTWKIVGEKA